MGVGVGVNDAAAGNRERCVSLRKSNVARDPSPWRRSTVGKVKLRRAQAPWGVRTPSGRGQYPARRDPINSGTVDTYPGPQP